MTPVFPVSEKWHYKPRTRVHVRAHTRTHAMAQSRPSWWVDLDSHGADLAAHARALARLDAGYHLDQADTDSMFVFLGA